MKGKIDKAKMSIGMENHLYTGNSTTEKPDVDNKPSNILLAVAALLLIISIMSGVLICLLRHRKVGSVDDEEIELNKSNAVDETTHLKRPSNAI